MFLDVVNDDAPRADATVIFQGVEDEACAFEFVFEMRRVDKDELVVAGRQVNLHFKNTQFVS